MLLAFAALGRLCAAASSRELAQAPTALPSVASEFSGGQWAGACSSVPNNLAYLGSGGAPSVTDTTDAATGELQGSLVTLTGVYQAPGALFTDASVLQSFDDQGSIVCQARRGRARGIVP